MEIGDGQVMSITYRTKDGPADYVFSLEQQCETIHGEPAFSHNRHTRNALPSCYDANSTNAKTFVTNEYTHWQTLATLCFTS